MQAFIARQPIFDRKRRVLAYELFFRDGLSRTLDGASGTDATAQVMANSALLFGIEALTGDKKAFINVTREVLTKGYMHVFPSDKVVPEIVEDVAEEPAVVAACRDLKEAGFRIALDNFSPGRGGPLTELADLIKVDFTATDRRDQETLAQRFQNRSVELVAEKVETYEEFARALDLGYSQFQGFFFARPEVLSRQSIPAGKLQCLDLLRRIHEPELSFDQLHDIIRKDVSLSYRLLRYLNSASFGLRVEVKSIRHALILLGEKGIRKWATLISMVYLGESKPPELLSTALARARFCEELAVPAGMSDRSQELFLMGLLSTLDAVVDQPLVECLEGVPVADEIREALLGAPGRYRDILDLTLHYEKSEWDHLFESAERLGVPSSPTPEIYLTAIRWARDVYGGGVTQESPDQDRSSTGARSSRRR